MRIFRHRFAFFAALVKSAKNEEVAKMSENEISVKIVCLCDSVNNIKYKIDFVEKNYAK